jgi:DNA-binding transcriptional regulator YiaG
MATAAEICKARELLGETHKEFAMRFNVSRTTIYHWEKVGPPRDGPAALYVDLVVKSIFNAISLVNSE